MTRTPYLLGGFQTDFARVWSREGLDLSDMIGEATAGALDACGLDASRIDTIHVGNAFGELQRGQAHLGSLVSQMTPALWGVPAMRHEGACASSSLAILAAAAEIEAGRYECALVIGVEELKNTPGDESSRNQNAAAWQGREDIDCAFMWPAAFGLIAAEYERRYGLDRKYLNAIAATNYANAKRNPLAQTRRWRFDAESFTDDDAANPLIEPGTRRQDCAQITDGACAVILASPDFTHTWLKQDPARKAARLAGWGHRNAPIRLRDKLEASRDAPYVFPHVRATIEDAWRRAGIAGVDAVDVIETHDCFTTTQYMAIDHFGLTAPGESWRAIEDGSLELGGRTPVNPSGGLIGVGHPVGATGARMALDGWRQVTGGAGAMQVEGAQVAQTLNIGGSCGTVVSLVVAAA